VPLEASPNFEGSLDANVILPQSIRSVKAANTLFSTTTGQERSWPPCGAFLIQQDGPPPASNLLTSELEMLP